jgi:hypothetical protein
MRGHWQFCEDQGVPICGKITTTTNTHQPLAHAHFTVHTPTHDANLTITAMIPVQEHEVALLVLRYLQAKPFRKTAVIFAKEAAALFRDLDMVRVLCGYVSCVSGRWSGKMEERVCA